MADVVLCIRFDNTPGRGSWGQIVFIITVRGAFARRCGRLRPLAAAERLEGHLNALITTGAQIQVLFIRAVTFEEQRDGVPTGPQPQALKDAVEIVNDTCEISIDEHLRLPRCYLQAER